MGARILIVEDEPAQVELLEYNLKASGFETDVAMDGEEALLRIRESNPDLVILDWMLPGLSGVEVCRRIRADKSTRRVPIILLTARGEEQDRLRGLDTGADDYVVKPYSPSEVIARVRAVLRRAGTALDEEVIEWADIEMDLGAHKVTRGGKNLHLSPIEFKLLRTLIERPGRVYSREQLLDQVWGQDINVEVRTVDVHVRRLRKVLNENGGDDLIRTVRGEGYAVEKNA
jgi:two-component system phosphate regulon response regulator PhoB